MLRLLCTVGRTLPLTPPLLQYGGLFFGFSMFRNGINIYYTLSHFIATVMLSYFTTMIWSYDYYWILVVAFRSPTTTPLDLLQF